MTYDEFVALFREMIPPGTMFQYPEALSRRLFLTKWTSPAFVDIPQLPVCSSP